LRGRARSPNQTYRPNPGTNAIATRPSAPASYSDPGLDWLADYRARAGTDDAAAAGAGHDEARGDPWAACFSELGRIASDLGHAGARVQRHAADVGLGYRRPGEAEERRWPLSPVPLMIDAAEWAHVEAGVIQRAELLEAVTADLYGPGRLVADGRLPASLAPGSPFFLRQLVGVEPAGGRHLRFVAFDLIREPDRNGGNWRVVADRLRAPSGAGYALENRLAVSRTLGGLQARLGVHRHAPFFSAFREGLAAACRRAEPRIALMTPGRLTASYAEQAHLARYLGLLLVEGADLAALDGRLYVRTIGGLKRVDALWQRLDPRLLDPLALDSHSAIGVAGLADAWAAGNAVLANAPGAGAVEATAFLAFLPALARHLTGEPLRLPNLATWWLGADAVREGVVGMLDRLRLAPAFGAVPLGLAGSGPVRLADLDAPARDRLLADLDRRPQDYVAQEEVAVQTMPALVDGRLEPRPFALRVFAARGGDGAWRVLPGGFARMAEAGGLDGGADRWTAGGLSADACVHGPDPVQPDTLLPEAMSQRVRRNRGTLPSRVADDFFWLGRYLERGEDLLAAVRLLLGHSIDADGGAALGPGTLDRLVGFIAAAGAASPPPSFDRAELTRFAGAALERGDHSVNGLNAVARRIGAGLRDRLSADMVTLLDAPFPDQWGMLARAGSLQRRYAALAGLVAEHMNRSTAWRFHDLGRRVERGLFVARITRLFGADGAGADDLSTLLDLADNQITYRQRYLAGLSHDAVVDLVALDPGNPRGLAYQAAAIAAHLDALPVLADDGMAEPQQAEATALAADLATTTAAGLTPDLLLRVEQRLFRLSDLVARRYFLQGAERLRADGLTLG